MTIAQEAFPKIRGDKIDSKQEGSCCKDTHNKNSQTVERDTERALFLPRPVGFASQEPLPLQGPEVVGLGESEDSAAVLVKSWLGARARKSHQYTSMFFVLLLICMYIRIRINRKTDR